MIDAPARTTGGGVTVAAPVDRPRRGLAGAGGAPVRRVVFLFRRRRAGPAHATATITAPLLLRPRGPLLAPLAAAAAALLLRRGRLGRRRGLGGVGGRLPALKVLHLGGNPAPREMVEAVEGMIGGPARGAPQTSDLELPPAGGDVTASDIV